MKIKKLLPWRLNNRLLAVFVLLTVFRFAAAQESSVAYLSVEADDSLTVFVDDQMVSNGGFENLALQPGIYSISAANLNSFDWLNRKYEEQIELVAGVKRNLTAKLPEYIYIRSLPFGAAVYSGESILGLTPVALRRTRQMKSLTLKKEGFRELSFELQPKTRYYFFKLQGDKNRANQVVLHAPDNDSENGWLKKSLVISSFAASWTAFYLKREADKSYDAYLGTGDPVAMKRNFDRTQKYDTLSEIALTVSVVTLSTYIYFLLSE